MENLQHKFRIWDKSTKAFSYVTLGLDECPIGEEFIYQQCLDVKDFYEKDLYEGDIVLVNGYYSFITRTIKLTNSFFLSFFTLANQFGYSELHSNYSNLLKLKCEGNIFENPELLNENKELQKQRELLETSPFLDWAVQPKTNNK